MFEYDRAVRDLDGVYRYAFFASFLISATGPVNVAMWRLVAHSTMPRTPEQTQ